MLFNSVEFAIFFPVVYLLYWSMRRQYRWQNALLFAASLFFYGWWDVRFLYLFVLTTTVDFYCALMIARGTVTLRQRIIESLVLVGAAFFCVTVQWKNLDFHMIGLRPAFGHIHLARLVPHTLKGWWVTIATIAFVGLVNLFDQPLRSFSPERRRKVFIIASLVSNLGVLGFFKYFNFFADSLSASLNTLGLHADFVTLKIILPVGISFYTFQSLAYTIDVYRRKVEPVERYLDLATCLSFFPLLVAGPIERPGHLIPQFHRPRSTDWEQWKYGAWLIGWGLFKKMVIADNMSVLVGDIFRPYDGLNGVAPSHLVPHDGLRMLFALYAFALQIYGDFSGYSDIARGTARLLGFEIMENFRLPYFAISPADFWQRWHISLSTWLRDYLYIPLGGNRKGTAKTYRNLFLTMLLGGLWHGAAWTFVLWGAFHGSILIIYRLLFPTLGDRHLQPPPPKVEPGTAAPPHARQALQPIAAALTSSPGTPGEDRGGGFARGLPRADPHPNPLPEYQGRGIMEQLPLILFGSLGVVSGGTSGALWEKIRQPLGYAVAGIVMFHLTCLGWLLFRARNMTTVGVFLNSIVLHPHWSADAASTLRQILFYGWFLVLFQIAQVVTGTMNPLAKAHWFVRLNFWIITIMSLFALCGHSQTFIYFNF